MHEPRAATSSGEPEPSIEQLLAITSAAAKEAFSELRKQLLDLPGVHEHVERKRVTYWRAKAFASFYFKEAYVGVMFKGGEEVPHIEGIQIDDIKASNYGYPWRCRLRAHNDIASVFRLLSTAYDFG